jgi:beta-1,4-mannosyltransferase
MADMRFRASRRARPTTDPIVVQLSLAPPDGTTKYVDQLLGDEGDVRYVFFTWRRALAGRYDVFHVHWPELMIRGRKPLKRFARRRAMDLFLVLLKLRGIPLVRTVHNVTPHEEGPRSERRSLRRVDAATSLYIVLNETTPLPTDRPAVLVPHGHYRAQFAHDPGTQPELDRILYFGIIRPYKGVVELVDVFRTWDAPQATLRIVGATSPGLDAVVLEHAAGDDRISTWLEFVDDADLIAEVGAAELIVLPYREMHNSGAILVALSLDRPVLAPATAAMRATQREVGEDWVMLYDGDLDAAVLERAAAWARDTPRGAEVDLSGRDWPRVRALHTAAYRLALGEISAGEAAEAGAREPERIRA